MNYTRAEAARELKVTESVIDTMIKRLRLEVISGAGKKGDPHMLSGEDVRRIRDERVRSQSVPRLKVIATLGTDDDVDEALIVSGLRAVPASNLLDAISIHYPGDWPVVVAHRAAVEAEAGLFASYDGEIDVIQYEHGDSLREIVREAWEAVQKRLK